MCRLEQKRWWANVVALTASDIYDFFVDMNRGRNLFRCTSKTTRERSRKSTIN